MLKRFWRNWKWPIILIAAVIVLWLCFVPFAKMVFVEKTLEVYKEVENKYSKDESDAQEYQGVIIDTLIRESANAKGKQDTTIHRQTILLSPNVKPSDGMPRREDVGVFGDSAGLLNAFFSCLAFMAVLLTVYLQSKKDGHDKQNGARVLFEQEFFAMVSMLEDIVSHLSITVEEPVKTATLTDEVAKNVGYTIIQSSKPKVVETEKRTIEGREVFRYIYKDRTGTSLINYINEEKEWYQTEEAQRMCFDGTLDHYFRYLYRILKHIDESRLLDELDHSDSEREKYAHLLRAQLSNYELLMWFYNSLLGEHPRTVKRLIEKYAMLNNLRVEELGKKDIAYYKPIVDKERIDDPVGIGMDAIFSVRAFWNEDALSKMQKEKQKKIKEEKGYVWVLMNQLAMTLYHKFGTAEVPKRIHQPRRKKADNGSAGGATISKQSERRIRLQAIKQGERPTSAPRNMKEKKEQDKREA